MLDRRAVPSLLRALHRPIFLDLRQQENGEIHPLFDENCSAYHIFHLVCTDHALQRWRYRVLHFKRLYHVDKFAERGSFYWLLFLHEFQDDWTHDGKKIKLNNKKSLHIAVGLVSQSNDHVIRRSVGAN